MNVTDFLTARLDEEEATAGRHGDGTHRIHRFDEVGTRRWDCPDCLSLDGEMRARVLREVEAMRAILRELDEWIEHGEGDDVDGVAGARTIVCGHLASTWSDHPDYREEWTPRPEEWTA